MLRLFFFFSSRRRHTRFDCDWSSDVSSSDLEGYEQRWGASYRQILDLADWDRSVATSVPGQSGQPGSPYYDDLLPLWAEGKYFPLIYSRARIERETAHRLVLRPAPR